jgi:hypothetical protein
MKTWVMSGELLPSIPLSMVGFGAPTVWGWGSSATGRMFAREAFYSRNVSYPYPAGEGVAPINAVVISPVSK